jgi:hypothetical protein
LCDAVRELSWRSGFVRSINPSNNDDREHRAQAVVEGAAHRPLLLVIDYAETRISETRHLLEVVARATVENVRVLLLARTLGPWWTSLGSREADWLLGTAPVGAPLGPVATTESQALEVVYEAYAGFAAHWETDPEDLPPMSALACGLAVQHRSILDLHAVALDDALVNLDPQPRPGPERHRDPLRGVLSHEYKYWNALSAERALVTAGDPGASARVLLVAALRSFRGATDAVTVLQGLPDLLGTPFTELNRLARALIDAYPGNDGGIPLQPTGWPKRCCGTSSVLSTGRKTLLTTSWRSSPRAIRGPRTMPCPRCCGRCAPRMTARSSTRPTSWFAPPWPHCCGSPRWCSS